MDLTDDLKSLLIETAKQLKGSAHRLFLARMVKALGPGGASRGERELGWNRKTKSLGMHELESGITCLDAFRARGHKLAYYPPYHSKYNPYETLDAIKGTQS